LFVICLLHVLHIISGLIYLLVIFKHAYKNMYSSSNIAGIRHCSIYWHFLDALWIYLFVFLLFMH